MQRYLVTGTLGEAGVLGQLAKTPISGRARAAVVFNASLAIQHAGINMQESFDAVIHLVSDPRISIEALSRLPRSKLEQMLPQPFAPANQTALHRAMVHWVTINTLLELFADARLRVSDLDSSQMPGLANVLLDIGATERRRIARSQASPVLTWADMHASDPELSAVVCRTGMRYGFVCDQT